MNITKEKIDALNAVVTISLGKEDYEGKVDATLAEYRKKARIDGFRPGKVPMGLINKMYRKPVIAEEVQKLLSESLFKYIEDEKIDILGEPLPSETHTHQNDFENPSEFTFSFDLGLAPTIDLPVTAKDKYTWYKIKPDDVIRKKYIDSYTRRYGAFEETDTVTLETSEELIRGHIRELAADNSYAEGGLENEDASFSLEVMKDDDTKKLFIGKKSGDKVIFDLRKAYPNDAELSYILKTDKEKVAELQSLFEIEIATIRRFVPAQANQEFYDKAYGEGVVTSEDQFKAKIDEEILRNFEEDSFFKFKKDVKDEILKKTKIELPKAFLKRWLVAVNEGKFTVDQIEKDFDGFEDDLKWQLVKNKIAKENNILVQDNELLAEAERFARSLFMRYGMNYVPDEHVQNYAHEILNKPEERRRISESVQEGKIFDFIKTTVKLDEKEISLEKFEKLFEEKN